MISSIVVPGSVPVIRPSADGVPAVVAVNLRPLRRRCHGHSGCLATVPVSANAREWISEAAYLPVADTLSTTAEDYREELMISLSSARELAVGVIQESQAKYKKVKQEKQASD